MRRFLTGMLLLSCAAFPLPLPAGPEVSASVRYILLKNGSGVRGIIVHRDGTKLRIRTAYAVMHIHLENVARILFLSAEQPAPSGE